MSLTARDYYTKDLLDEIFDNSYDKTSFAKCDIYQKDEKYCIEIEMPGITKDEIGIDLGNGYLTIQCRRKNDNKYDNRKYIKRERKINSMERRIYIGDIEESNITAELKNGILEICFPLENKIMSKKSIEIK